MKGTAALYIVGEPGVGKSELVAELTRGVPAEEISEPFAHRILGHARGIVELGKRTVDKTGTDSLGATVIETVIPWLQENVPPFILAEGDKLAVDRFMQALLDTGYELRIVLLHGPGVAARRRLQRGSHQNETWVNGRRTKASRLAGRWSAKVQVLDARKSVAELVDEIESPVAVELRAARSDGNGVQ